MRVLIFITFFMALQASAKAADNFMAGTMTNITSLPGGLYVMLDTGVPDNCIGAPHGWMIIKEAHKTMIATALTLWANNSRKVAIYTSGLTDGRCYVNQFDPM